MNRDQISFIGIDLIEPNPYNPNRQSEEIFDMLVKSIQEDGFTQPILVHKESKQIIDGEHRWRAARHLNMKTIPVVFVEMTAEQMRIATLRHNRARGQEEEDLTAEVFKQLEDLGALEQAKESLFIDDSEIQKILGSIESEGFEMPDFDEPPEMEESFHISATFKGPEAEIMRRIMGRDHKSKIWQWAQNEA